MPCTPCLNISTLIIFSKLISPAHDLIEWYSIEEHWDHYELGIILPPTCHVSVSLIFFIYIYMHPCMNCPNMGLIIFYLASNSMKYALRPCEPGNAPPLLIFQCHMARYAYA